MPLSRRRFLASSLGLALGGSLAGPAAAQGYGQTFKVENDEGRPVANMRLPGEITGQIQELRGVTYVGPREAEVTLYEFFDYNCPWCRKAAEYGPKKANSLTTPGETIEQYQARMAAEREADRARAAPMPAAVLALANRMRGAA